MEPIISTSIAQFEDALRFKEHLQHLNLTLPCDEQLDHDESQILGTSLSWDDLTIGNRFCLQSTEGWDATEDGNPTEATRLRWKKFGSSGAKLIWGGEAIAVRHDGRANPNQLILNTNTKKGIAELLDTTRKAHKEAMGSTTDLVVGIQLNHAGRFSRPNARSMLEPKILYFHPILNPKYGIHDEYPPMLDGEIRALIQDYILAAKHASDIGFNFIDIKHCHGYLGHEFLSAHTRKGDYGGSFENRTRFLREIVEGIRASAPHIKIGIRFSAFDSVPYKPDPSLSKSGNPGPGIPDDVSACKPYVYGFGVDQENPVTHDLPETVQLLTLLQHLNIRGVNLSAGSPYYSPHLQRPTLNPSTNGYQPPEDPLIGVARQLNVVRELKAQFPKLFFVGSAYSYLQQFIPNVAQAAIRENWVDCIGLRRMTLSYPDFPRDVISGQKIKHELTCHAVNTSAASPQTTFTSDTYASDVYYETSSQAEELNTTQNPKP